jgi:hypothetical protein
MNTAIDYQKPAVKVPWSERINFRMLALIAVIGVLVGYPVYVLIDTQVSGGIKAAANGYKEVNLKAMSTFEFDQANGTLQDIPQKWRDLDGQKVILLGEMWQPNVAGNEVQDFALVYSIAKCCVTSTPQVQHFVHSKAMPGKSLSYYSTPVEVRGVLHVNVKSEEGRVASVYQLDVESIKPAT